MPLGFLLQSQEANGIVIENIPLLPLRQEWRMLDCFYPLADLIGPTHLI